MADVRRSLGDSSDEFSETGSQSASGGSRKSVICYTEKGMSFPPKLSLSSEESEEDSSVSDRNSQTETPSRHQSSEFENEEFSLRARSTSSSTNEDDPATTLLTELESIPQIASRYTDDDPEYAKESELKSVPPPVITQWAGRARQQWQGGRGRGRGNHYEDRKRPYDDRGDRGGYNNRYEHQRQHSSESPSSYSGDRQSNSNYNNYNQRR